MLRLQAPRNLALDQLLLAWIKEPAGPRRDSHALFMTEESMALRLGGKEARPLVQGGMGVGISAHRLAGSVAADEIPQFHRDIVPILKRAAAIPRLHEMNGHFTVSRTPRARRSSRTPLARRLP